MSFYFLIYGVVAAGIGLCFLADMPVRRTAQRIHFGVVLVLLAMFAAMRSPNVDRDFHDYVFWFNLISSGNAPWFAWARDPAFAAISFVVSNFGLSYPAVEFIYAVLGLLAVWRFVTVAADRRWATLFFYLFFCQYFIVLEMTQIRAAVAIPLMACSLYQACDQRRRQAVGTFLIALLFHFSVIAALPILVLLFMGVEFRSKRWLYAIVGCGAFMAVAMRSVIQLLTNLYRISEYLNGGAEENDLRIISWYALAHLLTIAIPSMLLWKKLSLHERVATLACTGGLMLFLVFGWNTGLATRLLYLFDVYWLLIMMMVLVRLKGQMQVIYVSVLAVVGLALYCKSLQYVDPYSTLKSWDASLHTPAMPFTRTPDEMALLGGTMAEKVLVSSSSPTNITANFSMGPAHRTSGWRGKGY